MENKQRTKQELFALYLNQKVLRLLHRDISVKFLLNSNLLDNDTEDYPNTSYLELKDLAFISVEDEKEICRILNIEHVENKYYGFEEYEVYLDGRNQCVGIFNLECYDYLRSKSYALPFKGISVEKMIEWGWVKLDIAHTSDNVRIITHRIGE